MLPGTARPIKLPDEYQPPERGVIDLNLATHFLAMGTLENLSPQRIRKLNEYIKLMHPINIWNGCNGYRIGLDAELSLDATPISFHFINKIVPKPPARRRSVSVKHYFEEKYNIRLNYPKSPLLRDSSGAMYPLETVWIRTRIHI